MSTEQEIDLNKGLSFKDLHLNEKLGQHFLVDKEAIGLIVNATLPGTKVIEIGSGIGHVTEALSKKANSVVGIEIDTRFQQRLESIQEANPNIKFIFKDALTVPLHTLIEKGEDAQIVANIPFHITEPLLHKLIDLPISSAVLVVGDNIAREFNQREDSMSFGKMSLLVQTFFDTREIARIPRGSFFPAPRTEARIVILDPKEKNEIRNNTASHIFASLFRKAGRFDLVKNDIKQAIVEAEQSKGTKTLSKKEKNQRTRALTNRELRQIAFNFNTSTQSNAPVNSIKESRNGHVLSQAQALDVIKKIGIPESVLMKPFFKLDNPDIRKLVASIRSFYKN